MKIDSVVQVLLLGLVICNFSYINCCTQQRKRSCLQKNTAVNDREKRNLVLLVPYDTNPVLDGNKEDDETSSNNAPKETRTIKRNPRDIKSSAINETIEEYLSENQDASILQESLKNKRSPDEKDMFIVGRKFNKLRRARNRKYMCLCKETECQNKQCLRDQIRQEYPGDDKDFKEYNDDEYDENNSAEVTDDNKVSAFNPTRRYAQNVKPIATATSTEPTKFNIPFANNVNFDQRVILNNKSSGRKHSKPAFFPLYQNPQLKTQANQMFPIYHYRPYAMAYPGIALQQNIIPVNAPNLKQQTSAETNECMKLFGRPDCVLPSTPLSLVEDFKTIDLSNEKSIKAYPGDDDIITANPKTHELSAFLQIPKNSKEIQISNIRSDENISMEKNKKTTVYLPVYSTTDSQENPDYNKTIINQKPIYNPKTGYQATTKYSIQTVRGITPAVSNYPDERNNQYVPKDFSKEISSEMDIADDIKNPETMNVVTQDDPDNQNKQDYNLESVTEISSNNYYKDTNTDQEYVTNQESIPQQNIYSNVPDGKIKLDHSPSSNHMISIQGDPQNMRIPLDSSNNIGNFRSATDRTVRTTINNGNPDAINQGSKISQNIYNYPNSNDNSYESPIPQNDSQENDLTIKIDKQVDEKYSTLDSSHLFSSTKKPQQNSPPKSLIIQPPESYNIEEVNTNSPPSSYTAETRNLPSNETPSIYTLEDMDNGNHHNTQKISTLRNVDKQYKDIDTLFRGLEKIILNNDNIGDEIKPPQNQGKGPGNNYNSAARNDQYPTATPTNYAVPGMRNSENTYNNPFPQNINPYSAQQNNNPYGMKNDQTNTGEPIKNDVVLQNAIKKVLNNFVPGKSQDLLANYGNQNAHEIIGASTHDLVPEIINTPVLRNLFSVPEVENMITDAASNLLTRVTGLPIMGDIPNMIKNNLRNVINQIPAVQTTITPIQYQNNQWVTERISTLDVRSTISISRNPPKEVFDKIQSIINKSALDEEAVAKLPLVQNLIVKAVKHSLDQERGVIDESTIRRAMDLIVQPRNSKWPIQIPEVNKLAETQSTMNNDNYLDTSRVYTSGKPLIVQPKSTMNNNDYSWPDRIQQATTKINEYKSVPLIPVTERQLKGGIWVESNKNLNSQSQTDDSDIDEHRRKQLLQKLYKQQATTARTKSHSPRTNIYYDTRNTAGDVNPYVVGKQHDDNVSTSKSKIDEPLGNEPIKYYSPNDRILDYLKNHPSTNNPPLTTTPQYFTRTNNYNTETTQYYDNNNHFNYPTTGYQNTYNYDTTTIGYKNSNDNSGHQNENDFKVAAPNHQNNYKITTPDYQNTYNVATTNYPNNKFTKNYSNNNHNDVTPVYQNTPSYQNNRDFPETKSTIYYDRPDDQQLKLLVEPTNDPLKFGYPTPRTEDSIEMKTASTRQINDESHDPTYMGKLIPVNYGRTARARSVEDLKDSNLVYVGDGVRLPLTMRKLKDGSFALTLSDEICKQFVHKRCPCCLPNGFNGVIMRERRSDSEETVDDLQGNETSQEYTDFSGNRDRRESTEISETRNRNHNNKGMINRMSDFIKKFMNTDLKKNNENRNKIDDMYYDDDSSDEISGPPYKYQRYAIENRSIRRKSNAIKNMLSWMKDVAINSERERIRKRKSVENV